MIDKAYANMKMKEFDDEDSCEGEDDSESDENEELEDDDEESGEFDEQEITLISPMKKAPETGEHANTGMSAEANGKLNGAANGHVNGTAIAEVAVDK